MNAPTTKLSNGITVANFSSPHPFMFTDGSVLPACEGERVKELSLDIQEREVEGIRGTKDIVLSIRMTEKVREELQLLEQNPEVDIVLVPFMVLEAMKREGIPIGKCRVCRVADRQTKVIHTDKFCV